MGHIKKLQLLALSILLSIVVGCGSGEVEPSANNPEVPTPTTHPIFGADGGGSSVSEDLSDVFASDTETEPESDTTEIPAQIPTKIDSFFIYNDGLSPSWDIENSQGMEYVLQDETYAYSGENAIAVTPREDFGELYFTVSGESARQFPRERVLGVNFWIYGGEEYIGTADLAVAVVGSNESSSWELGDESVENPGDGQPTFSETRLYFLGINRDIPPETWVNVEVWLDELQYDPIYEYVTGFYIKNDEGFGQTFYVDDIRIMMLAEDE